MPDAFDFAIVGSTPFAALLAGSLAQTHGKRVLRIGRRPSPQRLPRRLNLALPLATRPQSWDILTQGERDVRTLIAGLGGPDAVVPVDVLLGADTEASADALSHLVHMASGHGLKVGRRDAGWVVRGVPFLRAERIEDRLGDWLREASVRSRDPDDVRVELDGAGEMAFRVGEDTLAAQQVVLADDEAIFELPEAQRPANLSVEAMTATLLASTRPLGAPVQVFVDRGVKLLQRPDGSVLALVSGETEIEARLAASLAGPFPVPRLATNRSRRIVSADGAPVLGPLGASNVRVVAGLGDAAVFLATAIARILAGVDSDARQGWFAAHAPVAPRQTIAEFVA